MKDLVPKLRTDLEIIPTRFEGQRALLVRDTLGLIVNPVVLQGDALTMVGLIDGQRTVQDIQLEFIRLKSGVFVTSEYIAKFLSELESAFLLESPRFLHKKEQFISEYAKLSVRTASYAGQSYPADREELIKYVDSILSLVGDRPGQTHKGRIRALISPHIDLETGKRIYAKAYRSIQGLSPRIILLLGTGHSLEGSSFSLTEKDFATPLGLVKTDRDLVRELKALGVERMAGHDLAFREEHSLEFQLVFLQRLFGSDFMLVPILCGSFHEELIRVNRPSEIPGFGPWLDRLKNFVESDPENILVVAGVDFSHIGPKFGHRGHAVSLILDAREHDRRLIEACLRGDVLSFWAESRRVRDKYNVCGFSSLACLLEILPAVKGELLDYEFWQEAATQSAVSFAAMVLIK